MLLKLSKKRFKYLLVHVIDLVKKGYESKKRISITDTISALGSYLCDWFVKRAFYLVGMEGFMGFYDGTKRFQ